MKGEASGDKVFAVIGYYNGTSTNTPVVCNAVYTAPTPGAPVIGDIIGVLGGTATVN